MGSGIGGKHVGGALAIVGAALLLHSGVLGNRGAQPLRYDHTRQWAYVKVPHRPATALERRLGDVAALVARHPVQVRCEDFSDGTPLEPGESFSSTGGSPRISRGSGRMSARGCSSSSVRRAERTPAS
jgi:hypothetical protein